MAIAPTLVKKRYENLSIEELEGKYEELKKNYCFDTKEKQIEYIIKKYLNASNDSNINSTKIALEELLNEKTGKVYKIEPKKFEIKLNDIINFVTNSNTDPFWTTTLINYFEKLDDVIEKDKMQFLIELVQDKNLFNEFTKEILETKNAKETYDKYVKLAKDYVSKNMVIS